MLILSSNLELGGLHDYLTWERILYENVCTEKEVIMMAICDGWEAYSTCHENGRQKKGQRAILVGVGKQLLSGDTKDYS